MKIDKDKQLVILDEEHEVSYLYYYAVFEIHFFFASFLNDDEILSPLNKMFSLGHISWWAKGPPAWETTQISFELNLNADIAFCKMELHIIEYKPV